MTRKEIDDLRYLAKSMPEGRYEYDRRFDGIYASLPGGGTKLVQEIYDFTKGDYWALLSPDNVNWMLDIVEEYLMSEDDLK